MTSNGSPAQKNYYQDIVHEFGHYGLGLYDEYKDGTGNQAAFTRYRYDHPDECPEPYGPAYGVMDGEGEFSDLIIVFNQQNRL